MNDRTAALSPEQLDSMWRLIDDLLLANLQLNLTSVRGRDEARVKHIHDSLEGLATGLFEGSRQVIDVGSGAGFPGLPLALARPSLKIVFLEATLKKCRFIEGMVSKYGISGRVLCQRAETTAHAVEWRERFHLATARAVGSFNEVCELTLPLVRVGGHVVLWRGNGAPAEAEAASPCLSALGAQLVEVRPYLLSGHPGQYHLVVLKKSSPTPSPYPRRVGVPRQTPLGAPLEAGKPRFTPARVSAQANPGASGRGRAKRR